MTFKVLEDVVTAEQETKKSDFVRQINGSNQLFEQIETVNSN